MKYDEYYKINEEWFDAYNTSKEVGKIIWNDAQREALQKVSRILNLNE